MPVCWQRVECFYILYYNRSSNWMTLLDSPEFTCWLYWECDCFPVPPELSYQFDTISVCHKRLDCHLLFCSYYCQADHSLYISTLPKVIYYFWTVLKLKSELMILQNFIFVCVCSSVISCLDFIGLHSLPIISELNCCWKKHAVMQNHFWNILPPFCDYNFCRQEASLLFEAFQKWGLR